MSTVVTNVPEWVERECNHLNPGVVPRLLQKVNQPAALWWKFEISILIFRLNGENGVPGRLAEVLYAHFTGKNAP